jgi:hypothetical protein
MARKSNYLVEFLAHTGDQVETLYLSTQPWTSRRLDTPANQTYRAVISDLGSFERSFAEDDGTFGAPSVNYGFIAGDNSNGQLDTWQFYGWGRSFIIKDLIDRRARVVSAPVVFSGIIQGVDTSDAKTTMRLRVRDRMALLDQPLLTERYAGTTTGLGPTAEGNVDLKGVVKPRAWGSPFETVPCKLVNQFNLFYQPAVGPLDAVTIYDEGIELPSDGDYPDLTALAAATIAGGHIATCLALGVIRTEDEPIGQLTAHVVEGGSAENRSAIRVAQRMLEFFGETPDEESFDDIFADIDDEVGIYVDDDSTVLFNIALALGSIEGGLVPTDDQTLRAVRLINPTDVASVATLTEDDLDKDGAFSFSAGPLKEGDGAPAWSVVLNWGFIHQTQQGGDLAGGVTVDRRAILGLQKRSATAEESGIKIVYPNARQITADTRLINQADAEAAAARRFALYGTTFRRFCSFPVQRSRADYPVGTVLRIDIARHGFAGGVNMMVTGRRDDFTKRLVTYRLWG